MRYVLERSLVDQDQLSPEGRKLIQDCRDIIETARVIVRKKNSDELFQSFLWNTNSVDLSNARKDPNEVLSVEKSKVQNDNRRGRCRSSSSSLAYPRRDSAARHLRTLGDIIVTNSEVRKILSDFSVIGRDILARTASHAADVIRPEREELTMVDRPAPSDQLEASGSRQAGLNGSLEGQMRSGSQTADDARHSEVTEVKVATEYVPVPLPFHRINLFNSDIINDADVEGDTKKSGFTARLQNIKASIALDEESLVI